MQDLRYALRTLRKSPGFAATAILTLGLGIGASTAVFTVVDSVMLKPLTYHDSGRLVVAWERAPYLGAEADGPNPRHFDFWRKGSTAFQGLTMVRYSAYGVSLGSEHPRLLGAVICLPNLFDILEAPPLLGRTFVAEDGVPGRDNSAILTYAVWQSLFGGDLRVIGKTVRVADVPREVVGVTPANFRFPNSNSLKSFGRSKQAASSPPEPGVFVPAAIDFTKFGWNSDYGNWVAVGRLKESVTIRQAEAQLTAIQERITQQMPAGEWSSGSAKLGAELEPMQQAVVGQSKIGLWLLMAAVAGLELIGCVNLANAQLGRALSRQREAAVRMALGAAKWRLVWNALAENLILAVVGGAFGVGLAAVGLAAFRRYSPVDLPRLEEVHLSVTVLLFSLGLTLASSILSGLIPAVRLAGTDAQLSLQQSSSRTVGSRQSHGVRAWLIGLQVFGCTALLLVTGLFSKSLLNLLQQDKGFETRHVAVAEVRLPAKRYATDQSRIAFDDAVMRNLRTISGVQDAGLVSAMPLDGETWINRVRRADAPKQSGPLINLRWASPGYFETLKTRLVAGRFLEERDRNLNSAISSEGLAKTLWPNESAVGGQMEMNGKQYTVVGVVSDSRNTSLKAAPVKMIWLHYQNQAPYTAFFLARGAQSAEALAASMRESIWRYAPDITIARVKTMDAQLNDSLAAERFQTKVLAAFGVSALLLAMLGIYGVLSYSVETRKQEIGVRMALGATRARIYALTFREAAWPVIAGLGSGLLASVWAAGAIRKLLYGIEAMDPEVMLTVAGLFLGAAMVAAFLPARRAASLEPMETLRSD